jgi:hypothetical protein
VDAGAVYVPTDCMDEGAIANAVKAAAQRRHPLPKMRFIVISRGVPEGPMTTEVVPGIDKAIESKWQQEQIKLAHLVPGGKRIVATQSAHMIPTGGPGLVVRTIRAVSHSSLQEHGAPRHADRPPSIGGFAPRQRAGSAGYARLVRNARTWRSSGSAARR